MREISRDHHPSAALGAQTQSLLQNQDFREQVSHAADLIQQKVQNEQRLDTLVNQWNDQMSVETATQINRCLSQLESVNTRAYTLLNGADPAATARLKNQDAQRYNLILQAIASRSGTEAKVHGVSHQQSRTAEQIDLSPNPTLPMLQQMEVLLRGIYRNS